MIPPREQVNAFFTIYKSLPWSQRLLFQGVDGRLIDLSAYEAKMTIKANLESTVGLHTFSTALGTITVGNGFLDLSIPDGATTDAFDWQEGVAHLVLQAPGELAKPEALFHFSIRPSTTDAP